ncbi:MAG TPA: hypothetical protein VM782_20350 [Stellaceae bacterium]|nr:hypothetical protein [Stellaceae bacterium]
MRSTGRHVRRASRLALGGALAVLAAAVVLAVLSITAPARPAAAAASAPRAAGSGEHPPECVPLVLVDPRGDRVHLEACGMGSLGESWALDGAAHAQLLVDGAALHGWTCGSRTAPCVVFWPGSPAEGQRTGEP